MARTSTDTDMHYLKMEDSKSSAAVDEDDEGEFFEALDDFPFDNCESTAEPDQSISVSYPEPAETIADVSLNLNSSTEVPSPANLRRRIPFSQRHDQEASGNNSKDSNPRSSVSFDINEANSASSRSSRYTKFRSCQNLKENESLDSFNATFSSEEVINVEKHGIEGNLTGTTATNEGNDQSVGLESGSGGEIDESSSNLMSFFAGMVVKAIEFQINILISALIFPIKLTYCLYMFVFQPFRTMSRGREYLVQKMCGIRGLMHEALAPFVYEWLKEHKSVWKAALKIGWGLLWSCYVCVVLVILLVSAFVMGGLVMRYLVEEPIKMKETLNFDYTESSPVAFVPIMACPGVSCGMDCKEKVEVGKFPEARVIPPNHKLQVTVSLVLPESDYNRNLGIFQVRVDFLSANGKALASSRRPCMLLFKSQPIRLLLTIIKSAPLIAGYALESQTLNLKFKGFVEGDGPTSCLRVTIEQRAEFQPSAGIPEIYAASLHLESELPLLRRFLWYWKKTVFMWISMTVFTMELLFTLLCCKPIIMPRVRLRDDSANGSVPKAVVQFQGS